MVLGIPMDGVHRVCLRRVGIQLLHQMGWFNYSSGISVKLSYSLGTKDWMSSFCYNCPRLSSTSTRRSRRPPLGIDVRIVPATGAFRSKHFCLELNYVGREVQTQVGSVVIILVFSTNVKQRNG